MQSHRKRIVDFPVPQNSGTHCHRIIANNLRNNGNLYTQNTLELRNYALRFWAGFLDTNMTEVLKLAARPTPYDNDERTWLEFRFTLENCLNLVNEKYVALLQELVAIVPAGTDEASVLIRTLSHTLYALLATLTTGRSLRPVQRNQNWNGFEVWRQLVAENAPKTGRSMIRRAASRVIVGNG